MKELNNEEIQALGEELVKVFKVEGITKGSVQLTFDPPWSQDLMSEEAKFELGLL